MFLLLNSLYSLSALKVRWPTRANVQQLEKTHANRRNAANTETNCIQKTSCKHRNENGSVSIKHWKCWTRLGLARCDGLWLMKLLKSSLCIVSSCLCCGFLFCGSICSVSAFATCLFAVHFLNAARFSVYSISFAFAARFLNAAHVLSNWWRCFLKLLRVCPRQPQLTTACLPNRVFLTDNTSENMRKNTSYPRA